jgi:hypothetical protein
MNTQHHSKVRVVIDCSVEERAYIKMLAARKHMTISEYFLSMAKEELAGNSRIPNQETLDSMKELEEGGGHSFESLEDFWKQMGMNPNA